MKTNLFLISILLFFLGMGMQACHTRQHQTDRDIAQNRHATPPDTLRLEPQQTESGDTVEYELIIMDPRFESWFFANRKSMDFYSQGYLESWNLILTMQWNSLHGRRLPEGCRPTFYLDYRSDVDYGMELNYKLFYYFRYAEEKCRLFDSRPGMWRSG